MSSLKDETINHIIDIEGGYVNDPSDSGGETKYGITKRVAVKCGYTDDMKLLPKSLAFQIYSQRYWDAISLDDIEQRSQNLAKELADTSVNMGTGRAAEFLQRSLNALNSQGTLFADLTVDRDIGPATLRALDAFMAKRGVNGELVLFRALNSLQGAFYIELVERRQKDEAFIYGWLLNRVA
jgi:lysozyme family protein